MTTQRLETGDALESSPEPSPLAEAALAPRAVRSPSMIGMIRKQRLALTGAIIIALFGLMALIGPPLAPYSPTSQIPTERFKGPSLDHVFGSDEFGRDVLSRLLYGSRISFKVGAIVVLLAGIAGVLFGLVAGYVRGWTDNLVTVVMDVIYAFPAVLLAIAVITILGNNLTNAIIAISLVYMPPFYRIVRGATLTVRNTVYVEAARSTGATTSRILARHVFPNITAPLIVQISLTFAFAILSEAGLSFLGLGNKPPSPSWGSMVSSSYEYLRNSPWPTLVPGVAIGLLVLGFNLLGDGLRDALDPRLRSQQ